MKIIRDDRGTTALEFALVVPGILAFVFGIIQIAIVLWTDNLLFFSVDLAARCGAVGSIKTPCEATSGTTDMAATVSNQFSLAVPSSLGTLTTAANPNCTGTTVAGISATFTVDFVVFPWPKNTKTTLTANSCYPKWS